MILSIPGQRVTDTSQPSLPLTFQTCQYSLTYLHSNKKLQISASNFYGVHSPSIFSSSSISSSSSSSSFSFILSILQSSA
jgi:hypothetical protein